MAAEGQLQPRRILMTADSVGGVWTYALELARELGHYNIAVTLATMGSQLHREQRREAAQIGGLELCEGSFRLEWMEEPWQDVARAGNWLLELEARVQPDVVHLNGYAHGALPWRAPTLVAAHSCVLSWWRAVRGEDAPPVWERYRREVARGLGSAGLVVAPTVTMLRTLIDLYGPLPQSLVIPNGRDYTLFTPAAKEPFVLTVGRLWDEGKNVAVLERVAPMLPWPVYAAGEQRHPDGGAAHQEHLRLAGRLSSGELSDWFGRAAIYALPARYEPFGLSALEAGLSGCALVLGDIPSLREVWGSAALFVPPDDSEALHTTLAGLIADHNRREALGAAARQRALIYSSRRMAVAYVAAYQELLVGHNLASSMAHERSVGVTGACL